MLERFYNTPARKGHFAPTRTLAGKGARHDILEWVRPDTCVFVCDEHFASSDLANALSQALHIIVTEEPSIAAVTGAIGQIRQRRVDAVVALGGGSAIDTAKAIHAALTFGDWKQRDVARPAGAPLLVAVPTTAGSGSETSRFVVLTDTEAGLKRSFRAWAFSPDVAVLDPDLLSQMPAGRLLLGALDSFCHLWETLVCRGESSPWAAMLAEHWIPRQMRVVSALTDGRPVSLDEIAVLQSASAAGGSAISNVRTGMMHTLAESLAPQTGLGHGETLAVFLKTVFDHYRDDISERAEGLEKALASAHNGPSSLDAVFELWQRAILSTGLSASLRQRLDTRPIDWAAFEAAISRDTTLLKEHPVPTSPAQMVTLARNAVASLCAKSPAG